MVLTRTFDIGLSSLLSESTVLEGELEVTVAEDTQAIIQFEALVLEIRRSLDYYESQLGLGAIAEIQFLCDPQHHILADRLADKLGVRFERLDPNDLMDIRMAQSDQDPADYFGLAGTLFRAAAQ